MRGRKALGIIFILLAILSLGAGGYIWLMNTQHTDSTGYTTSPKLKISSDSPAIVFSDHEFNMRAETPYLLQMFVDPDNLVTERWMVKNNLNKDIFIGIATADKASQFLTNIHQKEAYDWDVNAGPWQMDIWVNTYKNWPGADSAQQPSKANIWLASGSGMESAQFEKLMVSGNYYVLIMNSDGSSGLDVDLTVGGKMPLLLGLPVTLVALGIILGAVALFIYPRKPKTN
jgi:hypothetical protein